MNIQMTKKKHPANGLQTLTSSSEHYINILQMFATARKKHPANGLQTLTSSSKYYINILQMFATACERL